MSELDFTFFIQNRLADVSINSQSQRSSNVQINSAPKFASKNQSGNVGDSKHHIFLPVFIDSYYRRMVLREESAEELELKKIIGKAKDLHEHLRNYGQLGEDEKPLTRRRSP